MITKRKEETDVSIKWKFDVSVLFKNINCVYGYRLNRNAFRETL